MVVDDLCLQKKEETKLEILNDGKNNVTIIKHYFKNDVEIGQDNWGCCLEPHIAYLEYAESFFGPLLHKYN